jgi:hypothetical protein
VVVNVVVNRPPDSTEPGLAAGFHVQIVGADTRI